MKRTHLKRGLLALSGLAMTAAPLVGSVTAAHAALPAGQVAVSFGGSDTTDVMIGQMAPDLDNRSLTVNGSATTVRVYNIPAFSSTAAVVPGDSECSADVSWTKDPLAPGSNTALATGQRGISPFGSTAGRNYLATEDSGTGPAPNGGAGTDFGCIDIARSSGAPRAAGGGDKSTFEYYAFALDAVSWASTSLKAPGVLTTQNLKDIYVNCTITNWDQLNGGLTGPITRYLPQAGSGTRSFFISDILGGSTPGNSGACASVAPLQLGEENNGKVVASGDIDRAILPYSAAVWSYQAAQSLNPSLDKRNSSKLGGIFTAPTSGTGIKASPVYWNGTDIAYELDTTGTGVVKDSNVKQANPGATEATGLFPGVRYVYNVIDSNGNHNGYQAAKQLVGFTNASGGAKGVLCDATATGAGATEFALILSNGFGAMTTTSGTTNQAGSTCRFYAGVN